MLNLKQSIEQALKTAQQQDTGTVQTKTASAQSHSNNRAQRLVKIAEEAYALGRIQASGFIEGIVKFAENYGKESENMAGPMVYPDGTVSEPGSEMTGVGNSKTVAQKTTMPDEKAKHLTEKDNQGITNKTKTDAARVNAVSK